MRLDRYTGKPPKFRVFRLQEDPGQPSDSHSFQDANGNVYVEKPPYDYFVMKGVDINTVPGVVGYANAVLTNMGDTEYYADLMRMTRDFLEKPLRKPD